MSASPGLLTFRLAEIGGQLQKLRWEAVDAGLSDLALDIAHAIEAVAWAAGIYIEGANVVEHPGGKEIPPILATPPALNRNAAGSY